MHQLNTEARPVFVDLESSRCLYDGGATRRGAQYGFRPRSRHWLPPRRFAGLMDTSGENKMEKVLSTCGRKHDPRISMAHSNNHYVHFFRKYLRSETHLYTTTQKERKKSLIKRIKRRTSVPTWGTESYRVQPHTSINLDIPQRRNAALQQ